jgi:hypothetical protein
VTGFVVTRRRRGGAIELPSRQSRVTGFVVTRRRRGGAIELPTSL